MKRFMHEFIDYIWINYVRVPKGNLRKVAIGHSKVIIAKLQ